MRVRALLSSSSVGYGLIIGVSRLRMCVQQRRSGLLSAILMACPYRTLPTGRDETEKKGSSASRRRVVWCPGNLRAGNARGLQWSRPRPAPGVEKSAFEQVLGNIKTYEITTLARCEHGLAASSPSTQNSVRTGSSPRDPKGRRVSNKPRTGRVIFEGYCSPCL